MSMHPSPIEPVPEETARVARAAFRKGNLLMRIRDEIGILRSYVSAATRSGLQDAFGMRSISPSFQEDTGYGRTTCHRCPEG